MIENKKRNFGFFNMIMTILVVFIMWLMFAGNTYNPDYENFSNIYNTFTRIGITSYSGVEAGFSFLMRFLGSLGLSYQSFLFVIATIFLTVITMVTFYFSRNPFISLLLYIYFPFMLDIVQIRNSLAYACVLCGLIFLLNEKYLVFTFFVILASLFHITSLFYLCFLIIKLDLQKIFRYIVSITLLLIVFRTFFIKYLLGLLPFGQKYLVYLDGISLFSLLLYIVLIIANILVNFFIYKRMLILKNKTKIERKTIKIALLTLKISIILLLAIPFLSFSSDFFRLYRNMIPLFLFNLTNYFSIKVYIKRGYSFLVDIITFLLFILTGYYFLYLFEFEHIVLNVFRYNIFFGGN